MFWQIITIDQLHKASQLFINYLENTSNKQEINQLTNGGAGKQTPKPTFQPMQIVQMIKISKIPKLFFPLLIASSEWFCAYAKTVFYSAVSPYKSSYFTSELQQMQRERNQLECQPRTCPAEFDWLRHKEFLKFYALAVQEMDTKFFACEVWPELLGGQLPA